MTEIPSEPDDVDDAEDVAALFVGAGHRDLQDIRVTDTHVSITVDIPHDGFDLVVLEFDLRTQNMWLHHNDFGTTETLWENTSQ